MSASFENENYSLIHNKMSLFVFMTAYLGMLGKEVPHLKMLDCSTI